MPLIDRTSRKADGRVDPWLEWKVRLFVAGAGLGLAAMYLEMGWLMAIAAFLLGTGFSLRFLTRRHVESAREEEAEWDDEGEDHPAR